MSEEKIFKRSFLTTYSQGVIVMILVSVFFVHTPILLDRLNMTESQFGLAMLFFGIANVITNQLATRFLIPRIGTTNCLIISRLTYAFIPFMIFFLSDYIWFFLLFIPWGISVGIQAPSIFTQVAIIESKTKKILNPIFVSSFSVGGIIGASLSSLVLGLSIDPKLTFLILGILISLSSITLFFFGLPSKYDIVNESPKFTLPSPSIFLYGSVMMLNFAAFGIILNWSSLWLIKDILAPIYLAGSIIIFFQIGAIASNVLASKLIKNLNEKIVGPYLSIIGSILLLLSIMTMNLYLIFIAITLFGFFTSNVAPIVYRQAVKVSKKPITETISHVSSIGFSGLIFGPAIVGYSAENLGLTFNMYLLCVVFLISSVIMAYLMNQKKMVEGNEVEPTSLR